MGTKDFHFTPFGCRDSAVERYHSDPHFGALVDQLSYLLMNAWTTPTELREALILATTQVEFRTVRTQILDLHNYDIEDTVLDSIKRTIREESE
jgi:hypothetical protein